MFEFNNRIKGNEGGGNQWNVRQSIYYPVCKLEKKQTDKKMNTASGNYETITKDLTFMPEKSKG